MKDGVELLGVWMFGLSGGLAMVRALASQSNLSRLWAMLAKVGDDLNSPLHCAAVLNNVKV
jgi:hypothetical protein